MGTNEAFSRVEDAGDLAPSDLNYVELKPAGADRFDLESGDLLFNRTNCKELVGKTGLFLGDLMLLRRTSFAFAPSRP